MQAGVNVSASPWMSGYAVEHLNTGLPSPGNILFDAIITNPPYFVDSLLNPSRQGPDRHTVA